MEAALGGGINDITNLITKIIDIETNTKDIRTQLTDLKQNPIFV